MAAPAISHLIGTTGLIVLIFVMPLFYNNVAENIETMESMIEQCFSFNFTDITKYLVLPITNSPFMFQPIKFYTSEEKKNMNCKFKTICTDCELYKKDRCVGCPLKPGYKGIL